MDSYRDTYRDRYMDMHRDSYRDSSMVRDSTSGWDRRHITTDRIRGRDTVAAAVAVVLVASNTARVITDHESCAGLREP